MWGESGKKTLNSDKGGLEVWQGLVEMERESISGGGDNVSKSMKVVLTRAIFPLIRNEGYRRS